MTDSTSAAVATGVSLCVDENAPVQVWTIDVGGRQIQITGEALLNSGGVLTVQFGAPLDLLVGMFFDDSSGTWGFHSMAVVQGGGVLTPVSVGEQISGTTREEASYTWWRASASYDPAQPFYVVDLTTGQRAPDGVTHLGHASWTPDTTVYPLVPVTLYFEPANWGYRFTLHYRIPGQPEMVQSQIASPSGATGWQTMGWWGSVDVTGLVSITGSVPLGAEYWFTRDTDAYGAPGTAGDSVYFLHHTAARPDPLQWNFILPPPQDTQSLVEKEFYMPAGMTGGYVHQHAAERERIRGLQPELHAPDVSGALPA